MYPLCFSIGGLVFAIGIFKRDLLVRRDSFNIVLGLSIILSLAGLTLHFVTPGGCPGSGALLSPLLSLGLFRLCPGMFLVRFKREPRDTWLNWESGMGADRVFNIVYFVSAGWLWIFLTVVLS